MSDQNDEDKVGYGRPPKKYRFKKGQSGNPKGRSKKPAVESGGFAMSLLAGLNEAVYVTENGKRKKYTKLELMQTQLCNQAARGHLTTIKFVYKHLKDANLLTPEHKILISFLDGKEEIDWDEFNRRAEEKKKKDED